MLPYAEASRVSKNDRGDTGTFPFAPKERGTARAFVYRMEEQPDPVTSRKRVRARSRFRRAGLDLHAFDWDSNGTAAELWTTGIEGRDQTFPALMN